MWSTKGSRTTDSNSVWMVQSRSNFDDHGAHPVPYIQLVSPVQRDQLQQHIPQSLDKVHRTCKWLASFPGRFSLPKRPGNEASKCTWLASHDNLIVQSNSHTILCVQLHAVE